MLMGRRVVEPSLYLSVSSTAQQLLADCGSSVSDPKRATRAHDNASADESGNVDALLWPAFV